MVFVSCAKSLHRAGTTCLTERLRTSYEIDVPVQALKHNTIDSKLQSHVSSSMSGCETASGLGQVGATATAAVLGPALIVTRAQQVGSRSLK